MARPTADDEQKRQNDLERKARKRVKKLKEFYIHLVAYILVNALLIVTNLLTSPDHFWAIWSILGWGIGLIFNAIDVYGIWGVGTREWEQRKVRELILQQQHGLSAEQVRKLLRSELQSSQHEIPTAAEWKRIQQRLEHLEAIVVSKEWDLVDGLPEPSEHSSLQLDLDEPAEPEPDATPEPAKRARTRRS